MREHCCCDPLTAALITARCSVSTLGVNTWGHQHCGDLTIHKHARALTHTHNSQVPPVKTEAEQRSRNVNAARCLHVCKFNRLKPNTHHFPPLAVCLLKKDKAWPYCPQLISSGREAHKQRICATHSIAFSLTCFQPLWQINGMLQRAQHKLLGMLIYIQTQHGGTNAFLTQCCPTTCDLLQNH